MPSTRLRSAPSRPHNHTSPATPSSVSFERLEGVAAAVGVSANSFFYQTLGCLRLHPDGHPVVVVPFKNSRSRLDIRALGGLLLVPWARPCLPLCCFLVDLTKRGLMDTVRRITIGHVEHMQDVLRLRDEIAVKVNVEFQDVQNGHPEGAA